MWVNTHVKKKQEELGLWYKKMYWLIGRNSSLSLHNRLLPYKQILKLVWTYGIQIWGCAKQSNIDIIQRFQNKLLRKIVNAPWYIRTVTSTETWKWMLCLAKSRDLHKSTKKDSTIMRTLRPHSSWTTWESAQTPEEKTFWASLSDSVKAETVLVQVLVQEQRQC